jgi:GAF domain-containing protein
MTSDVSMTSDPTMTAALARAAKEIHQASGMEETLDAIVRSARDTLPDIDHIGLSIGHKDGRIETLAATDDLVLTFDTMQLDVGEGPCVYAMEAEAVVRVEHARHEQRWPLFIPRAVAAGLRSQLGVRLHVDEVEMAALNMYSTSSETLDPDLEDFAELFASYASLALGHARREDQLNQAIVSRRVIGQATGIVMERYAVDEGAAFRYLTRTSNDTNVKLRDLAQQIVAETNERTRNGGNGG